MKNLEQTVKVTDDLQKLHQCIENLKFMIAGVTRYITSPAGSPPNTGRKAFYRLEINIEYENHRTDTKDDMTFRGYMDEYLQAHWTEVSEWMLKQANIDLVKQTKEAKKAMLISLGMDIDEEEQP